MCFDVHDGVDTGMIPSGMKFPNGIMPKGKGKKMVLKLFIGMVILITCLIAYEAAFAHGSHNHDIVIDNSTTNNPVVEVRTNTITSGLSDSDISDALATAGAIGAHQFDFSTTDLQGSLTGAFYDSQDAISFGMAKRWQKFDNAMFHGAYSRVDDEDMWVVGGTFRF